MKLTKQQINKIKDIVLAMLKVNIANLEFQKGVSAVKEHKKTFNKLINHTIKSMELVRNIKHEDILVNIYNSFIHGHEAFYIALSESVYKNVKRWDTTAIGYQEFKKLEKEAIEKTDKETEEKKKIAETIKKAKEEGKKIEYMFVDGHIKPVIVDDKLN